MAIFKSLRQQGGRGGRKAAATPKPRKVAAKTAAATASTDVALAKRVRELEQGQKSILKQLQRMEKKLAKPFRVVLNR